MTKKQNLTKDIPTHIKNKKLVKKRREQLVQAAIKLFPQKGFFKTTLKDLAQEAGFSYGNIYDYVGKKEDIFILVHEFLTDLANEGLEKSVKNVDDPLEKLRRMINSEFNLSYNWSDAILFMYQDLHVLDKELLKRLLAKESSHVNKFKQVLDLCIDSGSFRNINTHIAANLIKIMIDSWVIKRWDLKGVNQFQVENSILELIFDGLRVKDSSVAKLENRKMNFEGKSFLMVNGGGILGVAFSTFLLTCGARVAVHDSQKSIEQNFKELKSPLTVQSKRMQIYSYEESGPMTPQLFSEIKNETGPFDAIVFDLGARGQEAQDLESKVSIQNNKMRENLNIALALSSALIDEFSDTETGSVLYIAPWAWDKYIDPILYETMKASVGALTHTVAKKMTGSQQSVNCILPGHIGGRISPLIRDEELSRVMERLSENGGLGEISDIVDMASFLISDAAKYVTGQVISVDGGVS